VDDGLRAGLALAPVAGLLVPARPAQAAGFVQDLGRNEANVAGTTLTNTTTGAVTAGNSIIVVASYNAGVSETLTCSDPVNGAYMTDVTSTAGGARAAVCSKHNVQALPAGSTITTTWTGAPGPGQRYAIAMEYSGIVSPFLDQSASTGATTPTGTTQQTGTTPVTSQAREVLVGGFILGSTVAASGFAPGSNGTTNPCTESGTPTYSALPGVGSVIASSYLLYCSVSATGAYRAESTTTPNVGYRGALATYRVASAATVTTTGSALAYTENAGATAIDPGLTVADPDSTNLAGASVAITSGFVAAEDTLTFTNQNGITGSYNAGTGVLTLSGTASVANYQAALRSVTYANSSENPTTAARTVTFLATDDTAQVSTAATRQIAVAAVNDAPVNTVPGAQSANTNGVLVFGLGGTNAISIADVDAAGSNVQLTLTVANGTLKLSTTSGLTVTGDDTGAVTATGPLTNLNAALNGLTFTATSGFRGQTSLTVATNDQGNTGTGGAQTDTDAIAILVPTLPTLSVDDVTVTEGNSGTVNATFTITLSPASSLTVTVLAATADGTATAGADYTAVSQTVTFAAGQTSQTVSVPILGDTVVEGTETFLVNLSGATNATITRAQGIGTIGDDDSSGTPTPTPTPTPTSTPPGPTPTATSSPTSTPIATFTPTATPTLLPQVPLPEDDTDKPRKLTEEERQQRQHTNTGNKADVDTEGNVLEVHLDASPPYIVIGNRDGLVVVRLLCGDQCPTIRVGDYVQIEGTKEHEQLYDAEEVDVTGR
jgi:hypothetical protein